MFAYLVFMGGMGMRLRRKEGIHIFGDGVDLDIIVRDIFVSKPERARWEKRARFTTRGVEGFDDFWLSIYDDNLIIMDGFRFTVIPDGYRKNKRTMILQRDRVKITGYLDDRYEKEFRDYS
jgi:hypothetical protein